MPHGPAYKTPAIVSIAGFFMRQSRVSPSDIRRLTGRDGTLIYEARRQATMVEQPTIVEPGPQKGV